VSAKRVVAVIGDSQAFQWLPALHVWGRRAHWKILVLTKASCRPWPSSAYFYLGQPFPECPAFNSWADAELNVLKPKATFVSAELGQTSPSTLESQAQIVTGMRAVKSKLASSHTRLIMFQNIPWFWNLPASPQCLVANSAHVSTCALPRSKSVTGPNVIEEPMRDAVMEIGSERIAKILPVDDLVCGPVKCPMLSGPLLMYIDDAHLTRLWVNHVEPAMAEMLVNPMKGL
jgi:hypothetical protein